MQLNKRLFLVAGLLMLTISVKAFLNTSPPVPLRKPLIEFPEQVGDWQMVSSERLTADVAGVLKADDYMARQYRERGTGKSVDIFVAYYKTQAAGESMHSPKNCLPGSGWTPVVNDEVFLKQNDKGQPIEVNRYIIENGADRALVLYWYQANGRIIANEYMGKFYLVWDALRTRRRDGAIVRLVVPLHRGEDPQKPLETGLQFARLATNSLPSFLPN
jgi:EpsI family protein